MVRHELPLHRAGDRGADAVSHRLAKALRGVRRGVGARCPDAPGPDRAGLVAPAGQEGAAGREPAAEPRGSASGLRGDPGAASSRRRGVGADGRALPGARPPRRRARHVPARVRAPGRGRAAVALVGGHLFRRPAQQPGDGLATSRRRPAPGPHARAGTVRAGAGGGSREPCPVARRGRRPQRLAHRPQRHARCARAGCPAHRFGARARCAVLFPAARAVRPGAREGARRRAALVARVCGRQAGRGGVVDTRAERGPRRRRR